MTAEDHVKSIHVFNEKNPQPNIGNFHLGPHAGRAQVSTRIRLADSQKVVAIARDVGRLRSGPPAPMSSSRSPPAPRR